MRRRGLWRLHLDPGERGQEPAVHGHERPAADRLHAGARGGGRGGGGAAAAPAWGRGPLGAIERCLACRTPRLSSSRRPSTTGTTVRLMPSTSRTAPSPRVRRLAGWRRDAAGQAQGPPVRRQHAAEPQPLGRVPTPAGSRQQHAAARCRRQRQPNCSAAAAVAAAAFPPRGAHAPPPRSATRPAGAISEGEVKAQIWALLLGGIGVAFVLDQWAGAPCCPASLAPGLPRRERALARPRGVPPRRWRLQRGAAAAPPVRPSSALHTCVPAPPQATTSPS